MSGMDANQAGALNMTPQMLQNQMYPAQGYDMLANASWSPYMNMSQVIGGPTVLGNSKGRTFNAALGGGAG